MDYGYTQANSQQIQYLQNQQTNYNEIFLVEKNDVGQDKPPRIQHELTNKT